MMFTPRNETMMMEIADSGELVQDLETSVFLTSAYQKVAEVKVGN